MKMTNFVIWLDHLAHHRQFELLSRYIIEQIAQIERNSTSACKHLNYLNLKEGKPGFFSQALYWKDN